MLLVVPNPVETSVVRVPGAGPPPANTLAFVRCHLDAIEMDVPGGNRTSYTLRVKSEFRPDGYAQANHEWYAANMQVSAAATLRWMEASTDLEFLMAIDEVRPFLDVDGRLGFDCDMVFEVHGGFIWYSGVVHAYVLFYEPQVPLPPGGRRSGSRLLAPPLRRDALSLGLGDQRQGIGSRAEPCDRPARKRRRR